MFAPASWELSKSKEIFGVLIPLVEADRSNTDQKWLTET